MKITTKLEVSDSFTLESGSLSIGKRGSFNEVCLDLCIDVLIMLAKSRKMVQSKFCDFSSCFLRGDVKHSLAVMILMTTQIKGELDCARKIECVRCFSSFPLFLGRR